MPYSTSSSTPPAALPASWTRRSDEVQGRCDVLILPRTAGQPGVALELKTVDVEEAESPEAALESALAQIQEREYATELRERGAAPIHEMAAVFDGKRAYVRVVQAPPVI